MAKQRGQSLAGADQTRGANAEIARLTEVVNELVGVLRTAVTQVREREQAYQARIAEKDARIAELEAAQQPEGVLTPLIAAVQDATTVIRELVESGGEEEEEEDGGGIGNPEEVEVQ